MKTLTSTQKIRYDRNIRIPEIGIAGQKKLLKSRVLVVGAGGLGSPALFYLVCAGVGTIGIIDKDRVELSNLQRQILHTLKDLGDWKTNSARATLNRLNPDISIETYSEPFTANNGREIVGRFDFVIEATDNFEAKFLVNDICIQNRISFSHAGILGMLGQAMTVVPGESPCYRCVFGSIPEKGEIPSTNEVGVLGAVAGVLGAIQATEAVKYLTGIGELLTGRMLTYDALTMEFRKIELPSPSCKVCLDLKYN